MFALRFCGSPTPGGSWLYKNKDHGMLSAVASLGAILLWNIDEGLTHLDKYQYSSDAHIKAGALLGEMRSGEEKCLQHSVSGCQSLV